MKTLGVIAWAVVAVEAAAWFTLRFRLAVQRRRLKKAQAALEAAQERRYAELLAMALGDPVVQAGLARCSPERRVVLEAGIYLEVAFIAYASYDELQAQGR